MCEEERGGRAQAHHCGDGAGVHAAARLCRGDPLDPVHAALRAQGLVRASASDLEYGVLEAALLARVGGHDGGRPSAGVRVARVHAQEVRAEERGLGAADAGLELDEGGHGACAGRGHEEGGEVAREEGGEVGEEGGLLVFGELF